MYSCLFAQVNQNFVKKFIQFLKDDILEIVKKNIDFVKELSNQYDFKKGCRVWREIDSFFENIVAVDTGINNILMDNDLSNCKLNMYGIRYGSLELPIIASVLFETRYKYCNIEYQTGALCLSTAYDENHRKSLGDLNDLKINKKTREENVFHLLMDDNLVTGRTLQRSINMLVNQNILPDKLLVVRYPAINRVNQMFLPNHGAPDTDLFWKLIIGLTSPTPYTRLYQSDYKEGSKYLDELSEFNKTRSFVSRMLYRNGIYSDESEVSKEGE